MGRPGRPARGELDDAAVEFPAKTSFDKRSPDPLEAVSFSDKVSAEWAVERRVYVDWLGANNAGRIERTCIIKSSLFIFIGFPVLLTGTSVVKSTTRH